MAIGVEGEGEKGGRCKMCILNLRENDSILITIYIKQKL